MSRRRRRVKIKSSSRLFAFIMFNLLLLASCITAHQLQERPQFSGQPVQLGQKQQELPAQQQTPPATQGISTTAVKNQQARVVSILSTSQQFNLQDNQPQPQQQEVPMPAPPATNPDGAGAEEQEDGETEESGPSEPATGQHLERLHHSEPAQPAAQPMPAMQQHHHRQHASGGALPSVANLCSQLPAAVAGQLRLCRLILHSPNADETVALGAARGLAECRNQFKSDRWNCTHAAGDHHLLTSKLAQSVGNRESGFVQAIAAAGIVHSIATACSIGSLSDCACDKTRVGLIRQKDQIWKWGGCSNNIRHGMMFAKHLVELLDAVHEHSRQLQQLQQQQQQHHLHQLAERQLQRRSLSSRHREPNQVRGQAGNQLNSAHLAAPALELLQQQQQQQQQQLLNFCQKNQNISQSTQIQLIKSLLSKNSLERHQDFRLAMNMHNNKVGRMAVAKNMEIKCRCHGLSGSCSLKTCWLRLPDFQQIGAYLKRKYDGSIHLPTAVNVNRLIPMMDRQELSFILLQSHQEQPSSSASSAAAPATGQEAPEFAALSGGERPLASRPMPASAANLTSSQADGYPTTTMTTTMTTTTTTTTTVPPHFNYYERHKQLERLAGAVGPRLPQAGGQAAGSQPLSLFLHGDETPIPIVPMSQQQYQWLLRDMRLCGANPNASRDATRQLAQQHRQQPQQAHQLHRRHLSHRTDFSPQLRSPRHNLKRHSGKKMMHQQPADQSAAHHNHNHNQHHQQQQQQQQQQHHRHHHQMIGQLLSSQSRDELVHLHKSPDYCEADLRHGFAGVQSRTCSQDPLASNSCDKLCCGRGFETRETQIRQKCDCEFQYCCTIRCNYCHKKVVEYVCR